MKINEYSLLVWKELKGEISPNEAIQLRAWLSESAENQREAARVRTVWEQASISGQAFEHLNLDAEFGQLQAKIRAQKPVVKVIQMWPRQLMRAAAALVFVVAATWGFRQFNFTPSLSSEVVAMAEGQTREINLPDGSHVWLRAGGQLKYPASFDKNERNVRLSGEAFFQVAHNAERPFRVLMADGSDVQVLGTEFNIRSLATEKHTEVFVKTGKVRFQSTIEGEKNVVLTDNQRGIFNRISEKLEAETARTSNDLAWQTGGLTFVKTPLNQVVADFEKYYGVKITLENSALADCPFTAPLINLPVEKSLATLAVAFKFQVVKMSEKEFSLRGGSCK